MLRSDNLRLAKRVKNDEFYTSLVDIEIEMVNYKSVFKDEVVFCNCDDIFNSNFVRFFLMHFNEYGLKELFAMGFRIETDKDIGFKVEDMPYRLYVKSTQEFLKDNQKDLTEQGVVDFLRENYNAIKGFISDGSYVNLSEDTVVKPIYDDDIWQSGDFRSKQSIEILKKCDIVVSNPPFSLFREYIDQLMQHQKDFLVIGNKNSIICKDIFRLVKDNKIWFGCTNPNKFIDGNGKPCSKLTGLCRWYTNLDHYKRHMVMPLNLECSYKQNPDKFYRYNNFDGINIDKTSEIPYDYDGLMGVPITFFEKFCPEQFELVRLRKGDDGKDLYYTKDGKKIYPYPRIVIKRVS